MMIRGEVAHDIGLLDEGFFLYFEEVEYCFRAGRAGWAVAYVPTARVVHHEGQSTEIHRAERRAGYWYDSRRRFLVLAYGVFGLIAADLAWLAGRTLRFLRRIFSLKRPSSEDPEWFVWDVIWGDLRAIVSGRAFRIRARYPDCPDSESSALL